MTYQRKSQAAKFTLLEAKRAATVAAAMGCDLLIDGDGSFKFLTSKGGVTAAPKDGRSNPKNYVNRYDLQRKSAGPAKRISGTGVRAKTAPRTGTSAEA
jgi:hypothetical protein